MLRAVRAMICAGLALTVCAEASAGGQHCSKVHARYRIYADGDYLWIKGSKHELNSVVNALDRKLMQLGNPQDWDVWGDFVICYDRAVNPFQLTNQDAVPVKSYSNIRIVHRPAR